jgi:hypothetical protein
LSLIFTISKTRYSLAIRLVPPTKSAVGWNVAMPSFILGAVPDAAMNATYPLAVYAAVCVHLGEPLDFPGSIES